MSEQPQTYFYSMIMEDTDPDGMRYAQKDDRGFDGNRFRQPDPIVDWPDGITFTLQGETPADLLMGGRHWVIVSDRLKEAFEQAGTIGTQFLPIETLHQSGQALHERYWAFHVVQIVEALDWEHTRWRGASRLEEKYPRDQFPLLYIMEVALRSEPLEGVDLFRLGVKGDCSPSVYVSEKLKQILEAQTADRGIYFSPIPAY